MDLIGGLNPLKNMKVNWDDHSQYMEKIKHVSNHRPVLVSSMVISMVVDMFML